MGASFAKTFGSAVALAGLVWIISAHGQHTSSGSSSSGITTNWVGYLVAGRNDTIDRISPGTPPTIVREVEIGLRSDGVLVWREAGNAK